VLPTDGWFRQHLSISKNRRTAMRRFVIEREIPKVGSFTPGQLGGAARTSNSALAKLGPEIQWVHSYVTGEQTFCIYLAKDEALIKRHAEISGFPANRITEVTGIIDPTTARN
jgi:hypothetical protein